MSARWIFDPAPPSGKRTGGSAAEYGFEGKIDALVRESVQNSMDARKSPSEPTRMVFRLVELTGSYYEGFLDGMSWPTIEDNLGAVPDQRGGAPIKQAIQEMEDGASIRCLVIEDYGTKGLEGREQRINDEDKNSYCALVRDELYSDKDDEGAGGSFGLGKSLLWAYSGVKTVLFASVPAAPPEGKSGMRFIGRTSLPYHETDSDQKCSGDGWFGIEREPDTHMRHAESVWADEAMTLAESCCCIRPVSETGLSAVIVGFTEPGQDDRPLEEIFESIEQASLGSFWPSIARDQLSITVRYERDLEVLKESEVDPARNEAYLPAVELLSDFENGDLEEKDKIEIGQSAVRWIDIELPRKTSEPGHDECKGRVAVLVALLEDDDVYENVRDRVFRFRKPGMIIRSGGGRKLSIAARPYVAAVLAGEASGESEEFSRVEHFLRAAEPPAHDEWRHDTRAIKQNYASRGAKKKIDRFDNAVMSTIRDLISVPAEKGGQLPQQLLKHLRFGNNSGGRSAQKFMTQTRDEAWPEDGTWKFKAHCRRVSESENPWNVTVQFKYAVDGGAGDDSNAIDSLTCDEAESVEIKNGVAHVRVSPDISKIKVVGTVSKEKLPLAGLRSAVKLRINGENANPESDNA